MGDEVWGGVKNWGLRDYSEGSQTFSADPVCGAKVDEAEGAPRTNFEGLTYYFCSKECQRQFEQAPGKYLGRSHGQPPPRVIDVNTADPEDLKRSFCIDDDGLNRILQNRPYKDWDDFKSKNPGFPDVMIESLRQSGVVVSPHDLHRLR